MPCFFKCCFGDSKSNGMVMEDPPQLSHEDPPLGLKEELIKKTCALAFKAHKSSPKKHYLVEVNRDSNLGADLIISFPGSWAANEWFASKPYGATKINHALFPSIKSVGLDDSALVNEAFQLRFESILRNSSLKQEVNKAMANGKKIVFTGHSSGAAVAILATLWVLEEHLNQNKNQIHKPPLCVTFGSPLVGNHIFSHATNRENWSSHFIHFVTTFDIVPLILLSPFASIEPILTSILQFFTPKFKLSTNDSGRDSVTTEFYANVMRNAATVTSHAASKLMDSTNLFLETVSGLVGLSPYRPFGTFVFCAGNRQTVVVRNSDAVLQLLFHTAQTNHLEEVSEVANRSILQHLKYEFELQDSLEMLSVMHLDKLEELPLCADDSDTDVATSSTTLDGLGLSTRARLCLRVAGELQKQKHINEEKINKEIKEKAVATMNDLREYKATCETHNKRCYYDAFKAANDELDFAANVKRLVVAEVWDEIIEMLRRYELPDEFEGRPDWIQLGTEFRRLVEPLDIANYYRHSKDKDAGPYMDKGRPKRYRYTQRWLEHAERIRRPKEAYSESCFWAEVEELCKINISNNKDSFEKVKERIVRLEAQIKTWKEEKVLDKDVLLEGSTLVKWWKALPERHKKESCIRSLIEV